MEQEAEEAKTEKKKKRKYNVTLWIFIGLVGGIFVGLIMPEWLYNILSVISNIYMNALRMMIYPMVFCSLVMGIMGINSISQTGKIGLHSILWFAGTTAVASGLGLVIPRILHLGEGATIKATETTVDAATFGGLVDTLENLIPANPLTAFTEGNMLQILVFAVIIGMSCLSLGEKAKPLVNLIDAVNEVSIFIVSKIMLVTPFGVFCCIAAVMYTNGVDTMVELAQVMIALYVTYALYALIVYGGIVRFAGHYSPAKFFRNIAPAALNAFGTCSSNATLPISMDCAINKNDVPDEIASLTLPLGATVNMDAVSIVMSFMITFFASACGVDLSIGTMITVLACNVLLSIGTPGVPGGAIAAFAALAPIAGLPVNTILGVYISVNTMADMGATCVNVMGDLAVAQALRHTLHYDREENAEVPAAAEVDDTAEAE
ncbi:MAG: dicarboxylate/amino acid:cation symporter [Lachnospiraceae bacterium]|jgi:Na+/H+-dicarboxylate symporter